MKILFIILFLICFTANGYGVFIKNKQKQYIDSVSLISWSLKNSDPDSAFTIITPVLESAKAIDYKHGEAFIHKCIGSIFYIKGDYIQAINEYEKGIFIYNDLIEKDDSNRNANLKELASCYNGLGLISYCQGSYEKALKYFIDVLRITKTINHKLGIATSYNNIGLVHWGQKNYDRALKYYFDALQIYIELSYSSGIASSYNNMAMLYKEKGDYPVAIDSYFNALEFYTLSNNKKGISLTHNNIGLLYALLGNYDLASYHYTEALKIKEELGDLLGIAYVMNCLGELHNAIAINSSKIIDKRTEYFKSIKFLDSSLRISKKMGLLQNQMSAYEALSISYIGINNFERALDYYVSYSRVKDSIFNIEKNKQIEEIEASYQFEQKQRQLENQSKMIQEQNMAKKRLLSYLIMILFAATLILVLFLSNLRKKKKISLQNTELLTHRHYLESLVAERTLDLQKAKVKAEESERLKSSFLANMSHEIRTPMNAILGFSSLLDETYSDAEKREELISSIHLNGQTLLRQIDDILDMSRIETRQLKIFKKQVLVSSIIEKATLFLEERALLLDKNVISKKVIDDTPKSFTITTDPYRLGQIINNLLDNALKYTDGGEIELGCYIKNDEKLIIYIKDSGVGISKEKQGFIFKSFTKIEDDVLRLYEGVGLGLAISKHLIEILNGEIWLESELEVGSTFYISLPIKN